MGRSLNAMQLAAGVICIVHGITIPNAWLMALGGFLLGSYNAFVHILALNDKRN